MIDESSSASSEAVENSLETNNREQRSSDMKENEAKQSPQDADDRKYSRRTRLIHEYIDTVYMLGHALDLRLEALKKIQAGEDIQNLVEANLRLSSVIARRMLGLLQFKREIDDEIEELAEMAERYGFELICNKTEEGK